MTKEPGWCLYSWQFVIRHSSLIRNSTFGFRHCGFAALGNGLSVTPFRVAYVYAVASTKPYTLVLAATLVFLRPAVERLWETGSPIDVRR